MFGYSLLRPTLKQDYFYNLLDQCREFNVPLEALHTETGTCACGEEGRDDKRVRKGNSLLFSTVIGPGVYEVALEYNTAMKMADCAQLFKTSAKQIGLLNGVITSFMAKPYGNQPGCSGHLHFSLRNIATGANAFAAVTSDQSETKQQQGDYEHMSTTMQHFLAGMLVGLPSILAILAPTINR